MIRSRTGHGLAQHTAQSLVYWVEPNSANHRYPKLSGTLLVTVPSAYNALEQLLATP